MHDVEQIDPTTRVASRREMSLEIRNSGGSTRLLRLNASSAKVVEVMGDFTAWKPVRLSSEDSRLWTGTFQIEPGIHEMNVRVDGGNWIVPSGIASRKDEFGGSVGIVVIR
jgi:1,4-alpha-glucan branching enzyme